MIACYTYQASWRCALSTAVELTKIIVALDKRGVRKFDLLAFIHNLGENLTGPAGNNPAMAKMLAAGGIHGLRPLRKERRVARNRFLFLFFTLLLILWGVAYTYIRQR